MPCISACFKGWRRESNQRVCNNKWESGVRKKQRTDGYIAISRRGLSEIRHTRKARSWHSSRFELRPLNKVKERCYAHVTCCNMLLLCHIPCREYFTHHKLRIRELHACSKHLTTSWIRNTKLMKSYTFRF